MPTVPETKFTRSGEVNIAYQVLGDASRDLVYVPGWVSNVEVMWDDPGTARFLRRLGTFARLIAFDKRGTGMSDPVPGDRLPTLEDRMDDVRAVMDAAGSTSATLMGHSEGGNMCILFAATYPERSDSLILISSYAKRSWSEDYPWAPKPTEWETGIQDTAQEWGKTGDLVRGLAPSRANDEAFLAWLSRYLRLSASPQAAANLSRMNGEIDTTGVLPAIRVPTLCLYRKGDKDVDVEEGRWIASRIGEARFVELAGADHFLTAGETEPMLAEIEEFVTGHRTSAVPDRVLATVLFTDIVGSTERAAELGDRRWRELLERHNQVIRAELRKFRGREVGTAGDGFLATFDGPARAISAAHAICEAVRSLGLEVRAGLHTGEVETVGADVTGLAVHIGARISALAGAGEVLVSRTVKDLVAGSGIGFEDRGTHALRGVPDEWQVYSAV